MTLAEKMIQYRKKNNLSTRAAGRILGTTRTVIFNTEHGRWISPLTIQKFGKEFEEFVTYGKCAVCGKLFLQYNQKSRRCIECVVEGRKVYSNIKKTPDLIIPIEYRPDLNIPKYYRPEISIVEYNQKAIDLGLTYGQLQAKERLKK